MSISRLKHFLTAPKSVITLILAITLACILGVLIPQISFQGQTYYERLAQVHPTLYQLLHWLGIDHIYSSAWFLALVGLLFIALAITVWGQFVQLNKKSGLRPASGYSLSCVMTSAQATGKELDKPIRRIMQSSGYCFLAYRTNETGLSLVFGKHQIGRWGSAIFHLGLLVLVGAGLYALAFHSRGFVQVMEGETIHGLPQDWLVKEKGVLARDLALDFSLRLDEFKVTYWPNDAAKELTSVLTIIPHDRQQLTTELPAGRPLLFQGATLYQSNDSFGYTTTLLFKKPDSPAIPTHFLLTHPKTKELPFLGEMDFPLTDYVFRIRLFPNAEGPSLFLLRPIIDLTVMQGEEVRFQGWLPLGSTISFDGNEVYFTDVRYWTGITAVQGYAIEAVYLGSGIAILGLVLLYFLTPEKIFIHACRKDPEHLEIAMASEAKRYPYTGVDGFEALFHKLCHTVQGIG